MRGQILDIRGNPLATSLPAKMVCADPTLLGDLPRSRGAGAGAACSKPMKLSWPSA